MSSVNNSNNSQKNKQQTPIFMYESQKEQQKKQDLAQKMNEDKQIKQRKTELSMMAGIQEDDIEVLDRSINPNNQSNLNMLLTDISQNDSMMQSSQVINQSRFLDDLKNSPKKMNTLLQSKQEQQQVIEELVNSQFSQKMLEFTYEIKSKFSEIIEEQKKENDSLKNQLVDIKIQLSGQQDQMGSLQNNQDLLGKSFIQKLDNFENFSENIKILDQKIENTKKDLNQSFDSTLERNYDDICKKVKSIEENKKKKIFEEKSQIQIIQDEQNNLKQTYFNHFSNFGKFQKQINEENKSINDKIKEQEADIQKLKDYIFQELNKEDSGKKQENEKTPQSKQRQSPQNKLQSDTQNSDFDKMNESINNLRMSNDDFKIDYYGRLSIDDVNINRDSNIFMNNGSGLIQQNFEKENNIQLETLNSGSKISCVIQDELIQNPSENLKELIQSSEIEPNFGKKLEKNNDEIANIEVLDKNQNQKQQQLFNTPNQQQKQSQQSQINQQKEQIQQQQQQQQIYQQNISYKTPVKQIIDMQRIEKEMNKSKHEVIITTMREVKKQKDLNNNEKNAINEQDEDENEEEDNENDDNFNFISNLTNNDKKLSTITEEHDQINTANQSPVLRQTCSFSNNNLFQDQPDQTDSTSKSTSNLQVMNENLCLQKRFSAASTPLFGSVNNIEGNNLFQNFQGLSEFQQQQQPLTLFQKQQQQQNSNQIFRQQQSFGIASNVVLQQQQLEEQEFNSNQKNNENLDIINLQKSFSNKLLFSNTSNNNKNLNKTLSASQNKYSDKQQEENQEQDLQSSEEKIYSPIKDDDIYNSNQQNKSINQQLQFEQKDEFDIQNQFQPQLLNLSHLSNSNSNSSNKKEKSESFNNINFKLSTPPQFQDNQQYLNPTKNINNKNEIDFEEEQEKNNNLQKQKENQGIQKQLVSQYNEIQQQNQNQLNQQQQQQQQDQSYDSKNKTEQEKQLEKDSEQEQFDLLSEKLKIDQLRQSKKMKLRNSSEVFSEQSKQEVISQQKEEEQQQNLQQQNQKLNFFEYQKINTPKNISNDQIIKNNESNYTENRSVFMETMDTMKYNVFQKEESKNNDIINNDSDMFKSSQQQYQLNDQNNQIQDSEFQFNKYSSPISSAQIWQSDNQQQQQNSNELENTSEKSDERKSENSDQQTQEMQAFPQDIETENIKLLQSEDIQNDIQKNDNEQDLDQSDFNQQSQEKQNAILNSLSKSKIKKQSSSNQKDLAMSQISQEGQEYLRRSVRIGQKQQEEEEDEVVYQLDEDGYLTDENGNYILDDDGNIIKLSEENIQYLKDSDMMEEQ